MAAKLKVDELESVDGSTNLILNNSVTMASGKTLPAASLTGALPAISGASLTGITSVGGATGVDFNDNVKIRSGTGNDFEIYHDGTHTRVVNSTGNLNIRCDTFDLNDAAGGGQMIRATNSGSVDLYYNDAKKLETTATGGILTGTWTGLELQPYFMGHTAGGQVPSGGVWTKITVSQYHDSHDAYASNRFTVPTGEGGRYFLATSCTLYVNSSSRISSSGLKIYKNGSATNGAESSGTGMYMNDDGPHAASISFQTILTLAAGDYVESFAAVTAANSGAVSLGSRTFMGFKIGA